jgi:hypothetical protein
MDKFTIIFTLNYLGKEYPVYTYRNEYYSLMPLISHYIGVSGFGLCSGMGSCGTCMIEISEKGSMTKRSTLSCDMPINEELANVTVYISD